jgi:hypothetical protein
MSKKLSKRQEGYLYAVFLATGLLLIYCGWKIALTFFLALGLLANLYKLITGKSFGKNNRSNG